MANAKHRAVSVKPANAPKFHVVGKDETQAADNGGLDFGGLKTGARTEAASDKPIITLEGEALELAMQFMKYAPDYKRLGNFVGSKGSVKKQIAPHIRTAYFQHYAGRTPDGATFLTIVDGKPLKLTIKEQYAKTCLALAPILAAVPKAAAHFRIASVLKIEFEKIAVAKQQLLVNAIISAAKQHGIEEGITVTNCVQPVPGFHESRTTLYTLAENIAIDEIVPLTAYPQLA
jgi:hypothetical protein